MNNSINSTPAQDMELELADVKRDNITHLLINEKDNSFTIQKVSGKHNEVKTYNIAPDFVPTAIDEICSAFIFNYCKANGQMKWLKEAKAKCKSKKGHPLPIKLRKLFIDNFFAQIRNANSPKGAPSVWDYIDEEEAEA
jgi:hypothetical protein